MNTHPNNKDSMDLISIYLLVTIPQSVNHWRYSLRLNGVRLGYTDWGIAAFQVAARITERLFRATTVYVVAIIYC